MNRPSILLVVSCLLVSGSLHCMYEASLPLKKRKSPEATAGPQADEPALKGEPTISVELQAVFDRIRGLTDTKLEHACSSLCAGPTKLSDSLTLFLRILAARFETKNSTSIKAVKHEIAQEENSAANSQLRGTVAFCDILEKLIVQDEAMIQEKLKAYTQRGNNA